MKEFKEFYSQDHIIKALCKIRIKYANKRHKKILLDNLTTKKNFLKVISSPYDDEILKQLDEILPNRRLWYSMGQRTFKITIDKATNKKELKKIDTDEKNREILFNTIKKHIGKNSKYEYIEKLKTFVSDIQNSIENRTFIIDKPDIIPEIKETNKSLKNLQLKKYNAIECRPISRFLLKDRIVISLTNKFLTELFDEYFEPNSLAFRAVDNLKPNDKNHHFAIEKILEYKNRHLDKKLIVAECDMKKFYDTVNHKICLLSFNNLIGESQKKYPKLDLNVAVYLFNQYLNCYSFNSNVKVLNGDVEYWKNQKDSTQKPIKGIFPWVDDDILKSNYYKLNPNDKIGVPQGGALSGLIANIMLDYSDKKLSIYDDLFYVRYCDDMILMHTDINVCESAIATYLGSLNDLQLFSHPFKNNFFLKNKNKFDKKSGVEREIKTSNSNTLKRAFDYSIKSFWVSKSKGPYIWGKIDSENNNMPWIGFVGYEINYKGETRIRKRSLKKEMEKQKKVVTSIIKRIYKAKNARNNTIYRSALEKLNGMSVGRIKLYNYKNCENKICWVDGFQSLNFNKFSKIQLRTLDRNKYRHLNILKHKLDFETKKSDPNENNEDILQMKKPFSYYFQAGEKKQHLQKINNS